MHKECQWAIELIHLQLDGELAQADTHRLQEHLLQCASCREQAEQLRAAGDTLRAALGELPLPPDLELRIQAAVRAPVPRPSALPRLAWGLAAAAAVAVAVYLGGHLRGLDAAAAPAVVARGGEGLHIFADNSTVARPARTGEPLPEDAVAWGASEGTTALRFRGGARLELSREAVVKIGSDSITLIKGGLYADLTEVADDFQVITPWGTVGGRGSAFALISGGSAEDARLLVSVGEVRIEANHRVRVAREGESLILGPDTSRVLVL